LICAECGAERRVIASKYAVDLNLTWWTKTGEYSERKTNTLNTNKNREKARELQDIVQWQSQSALHRG